MTVSAYRLKSGSWNEKAHVAFKHVGGAWALAPLQLVGGPSICPLPAAAVRVKPPPDAAGLPSPEKIRLPAVPSRLWSGSRCSALVRVRPPGRRQAASFTGSRLRLWFLHCSCGCESESTERPSRSKRHHHTNWGPHDHIEWLLSQGS